MLMLLTWPHLDHTAKLANILTTHRFNSQAAETQPVCFCSEAAKKAHFFSYCDCPPQCRRQAAASKLFSKVISCLSVCFTLIFL